MNSRAPSPRSPTAPGWPKRRSPERPEAPFGAPLVRAFLRPAVARVLSSARLPQQHHAEPTIRLAGVTADGLAAASYPRRLLVPPLTWTCIPPPDFEVTRPVSRPGSLTGPAFFTEVPLGKMP
jgi:hypothetical protein